MDIISQNIIDSSSEKMEGFVNDAIDHLVKYGTKMVEEVKKEFMPLLEDLLKNLTGEIKGLAFGKELETLDLQTLVGFAKKYIVKKSNEIVAVKVKQNDGFLIYLAYSFDRQLLPVSENRYVIIKTKTLSKEVENLFAESDVVILK